MDSLTLPFCDIRATSLPLCGGKGANLSKMTQTGFPVPGGFILTTSAFELFLAQNGRKKQLSDLLYISTRNIEDFHALSEQIQSWICQLSIPPEVISAVENALKPYEIDQFFAIRSSATAEDLPYLSFAGQQDTYLNIQGLDALLIHIRRCWASLFTERALVYRHENNIDNRNVSMAVVVQQMLFPELSGILFTADPLTNNYQMQVINASYGLGEALVSGLVNPDMIQIDKRSDLIIQYSIGQKKVSITALPGGGTQRTSVPDDLASSKCLSYAQVQELANLGKKIEQFYNCPQDIEWAIADQKVFLLQTRPITSLFPLPVPPPQDGNLHIYFSIGHAQMMTNPISVMGIDFLQLLLPFGRPSREIAYSPHIKQAAGRIYVDLNPLLKTKLGRKRLAMAFQFVEPVAANQLKLLIESPLFDELRRKPGGAMKFSTITDWFLPLLSGVIRIILFADLTDYSRREQRKNQDRLDEVAQRINSLAMPERLFEIERITAGIFRDDIVKNADAIAGGTLANVLLHRLLSAPEYQPLLQAIARGLDGNITTEMDMQVGDLAAIVAEEPELRALLQTRLNQNLPFDQNLLADYPGFQTSWQDFMKRFGMRAPGELDIAIPRWQDNPSSLLQMILAQGASQALVDHRQNFGELARKNQEAQLQIINSVRNPAKRMLIKRLLKTFTAAAPVRENPKYMMVGLMDIIRRHLLIIGAQLEQEGILAGNNDIWYLRLQELTRHFRGETQPFKEMVLDRKAAYQHYQHLTPPRVIRSDGEIARQTLANEDFPSSSLAGSPVSPGVVEGNVRVILNPAKERLERGEILVAPFTDPGWTPLFINAAGLILETGGMMTHGSVVAREYGIPAVVGIINATTLLQTGQRVRVNGDQGYVEILT